MISRGDARVRFSDGCVVSRNAVYCASQLVSLEDFEHSRIFSLKNGRWGHCDVDFVVWSICAVERPIRTILSLGRDGQIDVRSPGRAATESLPDAGVGPNKLGYVSQIRDIAGQLYVCGGAGQIYRRQPKGWVHFDDGALDRERGVQAIDLYSIDGTSQEDMYAVGKNGLVCYHNGGSWNQPKSPTQFDLNWVRCVSPGEVYLCGNAGRFFKGNYEAWEDHSQPDLNEEFWCVEIFQGVPYLAAASGLYMFDGRKVERVVTGLKPSPDGYHLHANDGVLWSFGADHLCFFDGKKWTYVKHPDNP